MCGVAEASIVPCLSCLSPPLSLTLSFTLVPLLSLSSLQHLHPPVPSWPVSFLSHLPSIVSLVASSLCLLSSHVYPDSLFASCFSPHKCLACVSCVSVEELAHVKSCMLHASTWCSYAVLHLIATRPSSQPHLFSISLPSSPHRSLLCS